MPKQPTKTVEDLVNAYKEGKKHLTRGNHRYELRNGVAYFYYWETPVCIVRENGRVEYDDGGYSESPSTRWTIASYKYFFGEN